MDRDKPESNSEWVPDLIITTAHSPLQRPVSRSVTPLVILTAIYDPGLSVSLSLFIEFRSAKYYPRFCYFSSFRNSCNHAIVRNPTLHQCNASVYANTSWKPGDTKEAHPPGSGVTYAHLLGSGYFTGQLKATYPKLSGSLVTHAHLPGSGVTNPHLPAQGLLTPSFLLKGYLLTFPGQGLLTLTFPGQGLLPESGVTNPHLPRSGVTYPHPSTEIAPLYSHLIVL